MSLYADEETDLYPSLTGVEEVQASVDPTQALRDAIMAKSESDEQAALLLTAGERYEQHPDMLPDLVSRLLPMVTNGGDSLLRSWTLEMVALAVGRADLEINTKLDVAQKSLDSLNMLLQSRSASTVRAVIPIFSSIYPMLFRYLAQGGPQAAPLNDVFQQSKARILSLVLDPHAQPQSVGVKTVAWKFVQRVLMVGTRAPGGDPRLKNVDTSPSITLIKDGSVLSAAQMEAEAKSLRELLVQTLYGSDDPAILHPILNTFPALAKFRPALAHLLISAMASWTPSAMEAARRPSMQIRAVEKTLRSVMGHLLHYPALISLSASMRDAMDRQKLRMEQAWAADAEERRRRRAQLASGKHPLEAEAESSAVAAKRARLEVPLGPADGKAAVMIDVSQFEVEPVIDTVMGVLTAISAEALNRAFENAKKAILEDSPDAVDVLAPALFANDVKREAGFVNPLDIALDDEDLIMGPVEDEADEQVTITDFRLPPPEPLPTEEKNSIADFAVRRIWDTGADLSHLADLQISDGPKTAVQPKEMWMLLLARVSSRGGDDKRRLLGEFVSKDFSNRSKFAAVWLNEEWLAKRRGEKNEYDSGVLAILNAFIPTVEKGNQTLFKFMVGLPEIPKAALDLLEPLCESATDDLKKVGFISLQKLTETRPPVRSHTLHILLQLCTHPERMVRVLAIATVRKWSSNSPMSPAVVGYAFGVLRKLVTASMEVVKKEGEAGEAEAEDEQEVKKEAAEPATAAEPVPEPEWFADTPEVESRFLGPVTTDSIAQYTDFAFAISRLDKDLLNRIFTVYPSLPPPMQDSFEKMAKPLVVSLQKPKELLDNLLVVLRDFPKGADKLALRAVSTLAETSGAALVPVIRNLLANRPLGPRFIIPVISYLDKSEIEAQLPSIVALLENPENREVVKSAFASAIQKMTPADLLVSLHAENASGNLKQTMDAIGICFAMPSVFSADVLANAMQRIVDQPTPLPVVFIRTVLQSLKHYSKSLVPVVANNILPKLVSRKVWDTQPLWEGFVALVRVLGQASFNTLLQMPVEEIEKLMNKLPATTKTQFKTFLANKPAARKALASIFEENVERGR